MSDHLRGELCGHYRLERLIDDTGRSQVWIAHDEHLDRNVALKIRTLANSAEAEAERGRFESAARTAARVEHPGIITVYESGATATTAYLAMRFVPGRGLDLWLAGNPKARVDIRFQILSPVAEALDHAHALGIAHGGVATSNILVDESMHPQRGALAQFGQVTTSIDSARAIDGDRIAFGQVLRAVFATPDAEPGQSDPSAASCMGMLRDAAARTGTDPRPTPATVVRTRRALPRRRRIAVVATAAVTALVIVVGALELLQDGMATLESSDGDSGPAGPSPSSNGGASTAGGGAQGTVLIIGEQFTSDAGAWTRANRKTAVQRRPGVDAADVVQAALLENPATAPLKTRVARLRKRTSTIGCRDAVQKALDRGPYTAIVVLESPCTVTVARLLAAGEKTLPPVYWLDSGTLAPEILGHPLSIAPPISASLPRYREAAASLGEVIGRNSGRNFARVLPFGTYRSVGEAVLHDELSVRPCFYLANRSLRKDDAVHDFNVFEDLRIAYSIVELANGFGVDPTLIESAEITPPYSSDGEKILPGNGTLTGTAREDRRIIETLRAANPTCILVELDPTNWRWDLRFVETLTRELPDVKLVRAGDPHEAFSPDADTAPDQLAAFARLMRHPRLYSIQNVTWASPEAPLRGHVDNIFSALYRPIDMSRPDWFVTNEFALVLVPELIGTQPADRGDGRPGFGRLRDGMWAAPLGENFTDSAPVELDSTERVYGGFVIRVYHGGELYDAFYDGGGGAK